MNSRRWLIVGLFISLAFNLLLVGGIIGRFMAGPPARPMPEHIGWVVRLLDEERRQELRSTLINHVRETGPLRRDMRQAQHDFETSLLAPDYDEQQTREALARLRINSLTWQESSHEQLVELLGQLDSDERRKVAEFLNRRSRLHRNRGDKTRPGMPGPPSHGAPQPGTSQPGTP